jgi:hypothetical protein
VRADMAKVIVERPRLGGGLRRPKGIRKRERLAMADLIATREGIRRPWRGGYRKMLNEHLGPLRRYLQSQVGRPWDKVHSEISQHLRLDSAVQSHVLDHLDDYVEKHVMFRDGVMSTGSGYGTGRPLTAPFYVCPRTGLLRANRLQSWKMQSWKKRKKANFPEYLQIEQRRQWRQVEGIWYEVTLEPITPEALSRRDVVLKAVVGQFQRQEAEETYGAAVFATSKRQLNKREIKRALALLEAQRKAERQSNRS